MPAYKDEKKGKRFVQFSYCDYAGSRIWKTKRGGLATLSLDRKTREEGRL